MTTALPAGLAQAISLSHYASMQLQAHAHLQEQLLSRFEQPWSTVWTCQALSDGCPVELAKCLRHIRRDIFIHTIVRDLTGRADLDEVVTTLSDFADQAITAMLSACVHQQSLRFGLPQGVDSGEPVQLHVIAMGKLGGRELNVSSDIDLVFAYAEEGQTTGPDVISNGDFFTRVARRLIAGLSEVTEDGFVFRVDMRLRPQGDSGPLVCSFDMLENYLITHGRAWERYAWIKARAVTGDRAHEWQSFVHPFVFRKYLDFGAIQSMRELHAQIRHEVVRQHRIHNVKLGPGGIREIEFLAQVFQLIRGGRETSLQIRPTRDVLRVLAAHGWMDYETCQQLDAAYVFLRRCEHCLMYRHDQQTQSLPAQPDEKMYVAQMMGYADWSSFYQVLDQHRQYVSEQFGAMFAPIVGGDHVSDDDGMLVGCDIDYDKVIDDDDVNFAGLSTIKTQLDILLNSPRYRSLPDASQRYIQRVMMLAKPLVVVEVDPDIVFQRLVRLIESMAGRQAYLSLLSEYPAALAQLIKTLGLSGWAAHFLCRHPVLLDELLDIDALFAEPDWPVFSQTLRQRLNAACDAASVPDIERQMDLMRDVRNAQMFQILMQDLNHHISVETVSDYLSALADSILSETLYRCVRALHARYPDQPLSPGFALIAYGKLGGKELGYASDLDLVFIVDRLDDEQGRYYARLAQRMIAWLSANTSAGLLYDVDMRLRPNGDAGLLITTLDGFMRYQETEAWVWEHQALSRARFIAGDADIGRQFEVIRQTILCRERDITRLRQDVCEMRARMAQTYPLDAVPFDLKHGRGGIVDAEFVVQFLVLAYARQYPELSDNIGNIALLQRAGCLGLLPETLAQHSAQAYRLLRHHQHHRALQTTQGQHEPALNAVIIKNDIDISRGPCTLEQPVEPDSVRVDLDGDLNTARQAITELWTHCLA